MAKKIYNYAIDNDSESLKQFESCLENDFVLAGALMPDAHSGYAAPIGSVFETKDFVVPAWVGFDIGCGLIAVKLKGKNLIEEVEKNSSRIFEGVRKVVPMGMGEFNKAEDITPETQKEFLKILSEFSKGKHNKNILNYLKNTSLKHLGTLGGGNHFIELGHDGKDLWLIIHSGSRGIGHRIATEYMKRASNSEKNYEKTFPLNVNSEIGQEYLNLLDFGLDYALLNRLEMSKKVLMVLKNVLKIPIKEELWTNKNHNHAILERGVYIHRKGATPAKKGERGIIPANMRDGCYLVEGLGNPKFLYSSSHGAGRIMSRKKARESITMKEFSDSMIGIKGTITNDTLDEAPMAYKDISRVMDAQKKSVKIINHLRPIVNWKGK